MLESDCVPIIEDQGVAQITDSGLGTSALGINDTTMLLRRPLARSTNLYGINNNTASDDEREERRLEQEEAARQEQANVGQHDEVAENQPPPPEGNIPAGNGAANLDDNDEAQEDRGPPPRRGSVRRGSGNLGGSLTDLTVSY